MEPKDQSPIGHDLAVSSAGDDALLDAALRTYARHFDRAKPAEGLTDEIMVQVQALRQASQGVLAPDLRKFVALLAARPDLQGRANGAGRPSVFVGQLQQLAAECGFVLRKGDIYALMQRSMAANDGELSDDQLDDVAAAGAQPVFHFVQTSSAFQPGKVGAGDAFSWVFSGNSSKP
jgi:hypothetical protein